MAHLVNSTAMRLGWEQDWVDIWFSNDQYYSELLYSCFRIRYYLIYLYFTKTKDKKGIIFSHFDLGLFNKFFFVNIYFYDMNMELQFDDFLFNYIKYTNDYERSEKKKEDSIRRLHLANYPVTKKLMNLKIQYRKSIKVKSLVYNKLSKLNKFIINKGLSSKNKVFKVSSRKKPIKWHRWNIAKMKAVKSYNWSRKNMNIKEWFIFLLFQYIQVLKWSKLLKLNLWYLLRAFKVLDFKKIKYFIFKCNKTGLVKRNHSSKLLFFCLFYFRLKRMYNNFEVNNWTLLKNLFFPTYVIYVLKFIMIKWK